MTEILKTTARGLYCVPGDFYIDPWVGVDRAIITHAHSDHARSGSKHYLTSSDGLPLVRERVGSAAPIESIPYGTSIQHRGVRVSLHPAGHILGSAQVRMEYQGYVAVVTGDYKTEPDRTCLPFELVRCHHFVTESTFGLPIYQWDAAHETYQQINEWWRHNQAEDRVSILYGYSLGKSQRLLAGLDPAIGPILLHGAPKRFVDLYREAGIELPPTEAATTFSRKNDTPLPMVLAPPSADGVGWLRRFGEVSTGFASGWMRVRGRRRWKSFDRGFVMSDHVDWPALLATIEATGAEKVGVTHGYTHQVVRWLEEHGRQAEALPTRFEGELGMEGLSKDLPDPDSIPTETIGESK